MKKAIACLVAVFVLLTLSACGWFGSPPQNTTPPAKPFSFDLPTPTAEETIAYYTSNDTQDLLSAASPYYLGNQQSDLPGLVQYDQLKKTKVTESRELTSDLINLSQQLKTDLEPFKAAYLDMMGAAAAGDKKLEGFTQQAGSDLVQYLTKEEALLAEIQSLGIQTIANPYAASLLEYHKTVLAIELGNTVVQDVSSLLANSAVLANLLAATAGDTATYLSEFETQMEKVSELNPRLDQVKNKLIYLDTALKQIQTGDYYLAQASLAYVQEQLPGVVTQTQNLTVSGDISAEAVALMQQYTQMFQTFSQNLEEQIKAVDQKEILSQAQIQALAQDWPTSKLVPFAHAAADMLQSSYDVLATPAPETSSTFSSLKGILSSGASLTWKGIKGGFQAAQTGIGVTLDTASAVTKSTFDVIQGKLNGNTTAEIGQEIRGNFTKIADNYHKGTSGSEILTEAGNQLEGAEDYVGKKLEEKIGKGWTSWGVGGLTKMTVGMFTGLGKGIYKIANKQSSAGTIAEGMLDVGLSLIGGSKTIFQGAAGGGKEAGKAFASKMMNYLKVMGNKLEQGEIKAITAQILQKTKLSPKEVLTLISNSLELEGKQAIAAELKAMNAEINKKFGQLIKDGLAKILKNAKGSAETIAGNYKDFVKEEFAHSLSGYKDALIKVLGNGYEDYVDNLVLGKMDDLIKGAIKEYVDSQAAPTLQDLAGAWGNGKMVITDIIVSEEFRKSAEEEGCDLTELENQKGKTQPLSLSLSPTGEGGGNMMLQTGDSQGKSVPFTYQEGVISASIAEQGGTGSISLTVTKGDSGFTAAGSMTINYKGQMKIIASVSASKAAPPPPPPAPEPNAP